MSDNHTKEEGELSDEDESGRGLTEVVRSSLLSSASRNGTGLQERMYRSGRIHGSNNFKTYSIQQSHNNRLETFGSLPNPRNILPHRKEKDGPCIVIKINSNINSNINRKVESSAGETLPMKSPTSKIWNNRKLRSSKENPAEEVDKDNYQTLLQQYKSIQGQLASLKQEEELLNDISLSDRKDQDKYEQKNLAEEGGKGKIGNKQVSYPLEKTEKNQMSVESVSSIKTQQENAEMTKTGEIASEDVEDTEEDEDELDLLELRRNALASLLAEARDETESGDQSAENLEQEVTKGRTAVRKSETKSAKEKSTKVAGRQSNRENGIRSQYRSKLNTDAKIQRHSRFLRARTPAFWPQYRRPVSYRAEERLNRRSIPNSSSRQTGYQSRSSVSTRRSRSSSNGEQKNLRRESINNKSKESKTNDIQKILSLDNPDEKIALLLSMLDDKLLKESEKRALDSKSPSKVTDREAEKEPSKDNYEEVEMDIDSDPESAPPINPVEELQFEPDFYNAMQPMYTAVPSSFEGYDSVSSWTIPGPTYSDTSLPLSTAQLQPYVPVPVMSFSDTHIPMMPYKTHVYLDPNNTYQAIEPHMLSVLPEQVTGLGDTLQPPPPPPLPCEPPPKPPLPPAENPPLPPPSPPPLPEENPPPLPPIEEAQNQDSTYTDNFLNAGYQTDQLYAGYKTDQLNTGYQTEQLNAGYQTNQQNAGYQTDQLNAGYQTDQQYLNYNNNNTAINSIPESSDLSNKHTSQSRLFELAGYDQRTVSGNSVSELKSKENHQCDDSGQFKKSAQAVERSSCENVTSLPSHVREVDNGEEEEALLRAQLLQSMVNRMREKQKRLEEASRSDSSPSLSRSQSPSTVPAVKPIRSVTQKQGYNRIHIGNLPVHKPVIINLGEDSSDEEEEKKEQAPTGVQKLLGGLDSFLKEARRSTEVTDKQPLKNVDAEKVLEMKRRQALMSRVRQDEITLLKHSENITRDQSLLKTLVNQASKYLQNVKISEAKVKQLSEQLAAAEKVATANKDNLEKAKKQARMIKDRLLKKKTEYENIEKSLLEAGRELHGAGYKIQQAPAKRVVQSTNIPLVTAQFENRPIQARPLKGKVKENMTVTINNTAAVTGSENLHTTSLNDQLKAENKDIPHNTANVEASQISRNKKDILSEKQSLLERQAVLEEQRKIRERALKVKEKKRLKMLALQYEIKLREMKLKHVGIDTKKNEDKTAKHVTSENCVAAVKEPKMNRSILRLEKIELGSDPIDLTSDSENTTSKRRRSLLEMNPSKKPNLELKADLLRTTSTESTDNRFEIEIPDGKALLKILKLQRQQVDENLKQFAHLSHSNKQNQEYESLSLKQQPLSCLHAYKAQTKDSGQSSVSQKTAFVYRSPLLHFKSYRFSPYFRTKACKMLTSRSFANKLLPKVVLCKYDLLGTCNDEKCKGQHQKQYLPLDREILLDIVSYCPAIAGIQKDTPLKKVSKILGDYVDGVMKQNKGRLTVDQMCLLLVSKVNEHLKHYPPHTMLYSPRLFRPKQDEKQFTKSDSPKFKQNDDNAFQLISSSQQRLEDTVILSDDRRYFYTDAGGSEVQDLESAVLASPTDTQLWLKLASNKLHSSHQSAEENLDEALNVLARALEANKESSDLWLEYLTLYARHKDAADFTDLCQMALQYAPSFHIWWKYLHSLVTYTDRNEVCSEIVDFLCTSQSKDNQDPVISHHLLEVMLYKINLSIMAGQPQYAKNVLQGYFVKSEGKSSCQSHLTVEDRCILWLSYIHVLSWQQLPDVLWDNTSSGKITNKKHLMLPWHKHPVVTCTSDQQMALLNEAVSVCVTAQEPTNPKALKEGLILYKNIIRLLQHLNRLEEVLSVCRDLLQKDQSLVDIWLTVANLYAANGEIDATMQVFNDALEVNPLSAKVFSFAAQFGLSNNMTFTMTCLEQCPRGYFIEDETAMSDPQSLYCVLLKQSLPLGYAPPPLKTGVTEETILKQQTDIWLNYCFFLEQRKNYAAAVEMYETALSSVIKAKDIGKIWSGYLSFQCRQIQKCAQSVTLCMAEQRKMNSLLHRCISTMPVKLPRRYWDMEHVLDYGPLNDAVGSYLPYLLPEEQTLTLERLVNMMPLNVGLVLRLCEEYLRQGEDQRALSLCYPLICDGTQNIHIWKLATTLAVRQRCHSQVQKLFQKAVQTMPFNLNIWKDYLMYQTIQGDSGREIIQAILQYCNLLGLNMEELLKVMKA